jgi:hypothetical protein
MKRIVYLVLPVVMLSMLLVGFAQQLAVPGPDNTPKVGQRPPDFELPKGLNPQAGTLGLKDFAGKKKVLLAFYVADFTAG